MAQRYCTNCGNALGDDDLFCASCGKPAHETAAVATPEADVEVPPPPTQQVGGAPSFAPASAAPPEETPRISMITFLVIVMVAIVGIGVLLGQDDSGQAGSASGGGSGGGGSNGDPEGGGGASGSDDAQGASEDQYASSIETFTRPNYGILAANPDEHAGAEVDVIGQLLDNPESNGDQVAFQMFADPKNSEWSTIVHAGEGSLGLRTSNYVHVRGEVLGSMEGENAFGGTVSAVEVDADQVERVEGVNAIDPTQKTVEVGQTKSSEGFSVTIEKLEFGAKHIRAHVTASNEGDKTAKLDFDRSKIVQGEDRFGQKDPYDYSLPKPKSGVPPGDETEGVVIFGRPDPSGLFEVFFEWERGGYMADKPDPLVFQIAP